MKAAAWQMKGERLNSFELFGYDLMVDDQMHVWLIEINSNPGVDYPATVLLLI